MLLFLGTLLSDFFGGKLLSQFFFWSSMVVFLGTYAQIGSFVIQANLNAWRRFKNKEQIFTNSLLDDEPDLEPTDHGNSTLKKHQSRCDDASRNQSDSDTRMGQAGLEKGSAGTGDGR